jgi:hypothetical protein
MKILDGLIFSDSINFNGHCVSVENCILLGVWKIESSEVMGLRGKNAFVINGVRLW